MFLTDPPLKGRQKIVSHITRRCGVPIELENEDRRRERRLKRGTPPNEVVTLSRIQPTLFPPIFSRPVLTGTENPERRVT